MARDTEKCEKWIMHTVESVTCWGNWKKNVENDKCTLYDLEYGEKTEKRGKWEMNTLGPGLWQETLKNVENEKCIM
jgi:hypothetical protein